MTSTAIQVAFPQEDQRSEATVLPPAPVTPANQGLAQYASAPIEQTRQTLSCRRLLQGDTLHSAEAEAEKLVDQMLANTQVFMTYGTAALEDVNQLITRLLHETDDVKVPELEHLMHELNGSMRSVKNKYDISDPKVREKYEHWRGGLGRFIGRSKTLVELLMEDVTSMETQLNKVEKDVRKRQSTLERNVSLYDVLYKDNEEEILKLIFVIGVMEIIKELAAKKADEVVVGDSSLGDRGGEKKAKIAELVSNMDIKIGEYKGRLMVAWATSPQVRTMRTLNVGLAERLNELCYVTIPTMKGTIVQWRMLAQSQEAAKMSKAVQESSNEWLEAFSAAGAEVVPMIAEAVQTPTLTPQAIHAMADSISKQADGVVKAMEEGEKRREAMDVAIMEAGQVITAATGRVNDATVNKVLQNAAKPLEIATTVGATSDN